MREYATIAAVDLGSNSFRLQVARVVGDQVYPLDSLKESVRLGAGLTPDKTLDEEAQQRALACLKLFSERLRGLPREAVRAVGTNTFRVAKNAAPFLEAAQAALGFPIEIVAGREEARLIYIGVAHGLPPSEEKRLVVDIGGGSTEFIIGSGYQPERMESLYMGCVSFSRRFFPDGKITRSNLQQAELAARSEIQTITAEFSAGHWQQAVGSSGTARALAEILEQNGLSPSGLTREGMSHLRELLLKSGDVKLLQLAGLPSDRVPVLAGGFTIMNSIFTALDIDHMTVATGALREGVLYDLLGRFHQHDMRESTVREFMRRYHVDPPQGGRVQELADTLFDQIAHKLSGYFDTPRQYLAWAARLHEVGISIAHTGYHRHSAYILANADMPGFSTREQGLLSLLARAHRGSLKKLLDQQPVSNSDEWMLILVLRLAVLFCRSRSDAELPAMKLKSGSNGFSLTIDRTWLEHNPLTRSLLESEIKDLKSVGIVFSIKTEKNA
ncbi:MAG: exopolyphosphatase [Sulfuricella denitrificans]|nr:exopolyphosphatase [Sulfuricella denitrificans]